MRRLNRREFVKASAAGLGAVVSGAGCEAVEGQRSGAAGNVKKSKPNFLFIVCDQLGLDAISAHGCADVHTPNIDRLVRRGVTFMESHSTSPVCSPARSSLFTGRMPVETGVVSNNRAIHPDCAQMGGWFRQAGYETVYCGKWHLPGGYPLKIAGFDVLPVGQGQGDLVDAAVSRSCETYLKNRGRVKPFVLVASLMQPHDICYWAIKHEQLVPKKLPFGQLAGKLPELPPNHKKLPKAPARVNQVRYKHFNDEQWRYYIYVYYRQVEMVDGDIGRILDALEDSGQADDTVVILTSDHGEGRGRHQNVQKWHPYDESMKVPMIVSCPGRVREGHVDREHLVSGLDVMSTMCDYAGVRAPENVRGRSLRPLLEGTRTEWREFLGADCHLTGRIVRTAKYKYVRYPGDEVEQLFDMEADPWETVNLYGQTRYVNVVESHRKLVAEWEGHLMPVEPMPDMAKRPARRRR